MPKIIDLTGRKFGRLKVLSLDRVVKGQGAVWNAICDCGVKKAFRSGKLLSQGTKSCGCLRRDGLSESNKKRTIHGMNRRGLRTTEYSLWAGARSRAKKKNLEFSISPLDIHIPEFCPLRKVRLELNTGKLNANSPSIDRIISSKGYTPDNIWIISHRANTVKSNLSLEELTLIVSNLHKILKEKGTLNAQKD